MNTKGPNDRNDSRSNEAKKWSRQNEQQSPSMNRKEVESVKQSETQSGAAQKDTGTKEDKDAVQRGQPESPASKESFAQREKRPREVGLANEARPGLGTRADDADPATAPAKSEAANNEAHDDGMSPPKADPRKYRPPTPEPREQAPDSLEHELQRSSGVSGHTGGS